MAIDAQRWRRLRPLLDALLELPDRERPGFLDRLQGEDVELRDELRALLAQQERTDSALDHGAAQLAAPLLAAQAVDEAAAAAARVGERIGPFRLVRLLGSGGMGAVYLAQRVDGQFLQNVALKVIRGSRGDAHAAERFRQERQVLAQLVHPNIAQLLDGGETADGLQYFTMEHVDGAPITDYCAKYVDTVEGRVQLLLKVAAALAHAHEQLVIHRDIKPSNILVTPDRRVKLLDFGIAKLFGGEAGATLTRTAIGPMTPAYAAPEQFRRGAITVATDVYQFGVLMFRLFTGRLPYEADPDDAVEWARAVTEQEPLTLPRALSRSLRTGEGRAYDHDRPAWTGTFNLKRLKRRMAGDLDAIVRKALAKSPDDRYRSMDALIADLESFQEGRPVAARRAGAWYPALRFVRRHRIGVAAATIAAVGLLTLAGLAMYQANVARREAQRANAGAELLLDVLRDLDPSRSGGREATIETLLSRGVARLDTATLADDPALRSRVYALFAGIYIGMGEPRTGQDVARRAIEAADQAGDELVSLQAHHAMAAALHRLGDELAARREIERIVATPATGDVELERLRATALLLRALTWIGSGDNERALADFSAARTLVARVLGERDEIMARILINESVSLSALGRNEDSRDALELALEIGREVWGEDHSLTLTALGNLGETELDLGHIDAATREIEAAAAGKVRLFGADSGAAAAAVTRLGKLKLKLGDAASAQSLFQQANAAYRRAQGDRHYYVGTTEAWLGRTALARGDGETAARHCDEAIEVLRGAVGSRHAWLADALDCRAGAALAQADLAVARSNAAEALAIRVERFGDRHPETVLSEVRLAQVEAAEGDADAAKQRAAHALETARSVFADGNLDYARLRRDATALGAAL
ncbi:MAG TPA: serine/threonine-protein kinase [Xanthomonadales bacterium]|nr:serine/threonine-protein kinase [Xanthomonadales bacterium]